MFAFVKGKAYIATPTIQGAPQRVVACIRRTASAVTLVDVREIHRVPIRIIMDRETAMLKRTDGHDCLVSAVAEADAVDVAGAENCK